MDIVGKVLGNAIYEINAAMHGVKFSSRFQLVIIKFEKQTIHTFVIIKTHK
jgi:hypothetical protein